MAKTMNLGKVAMTTAGDYDSSKSYERLTCVLYNHVSWVSRKEVPAGIVPGTNELYWQKVSERGEQGIQGPVGPQGNSAFDGNGVEIVNNLTQGGEAAVLSAEQGKILDTKLAELSQKTNHFNIKIEVTSNYQNLSDKLPFPLLKGAKIVSRGVTFTLGSDSNYSDRLDVYSGHTYELTTDMAYIRSSSTLGFIDFDYIITPQFVDIERLQSKFNLNLKSKWKVGYELSSANGEYIIASDYISSPDMAIGEDLSYITNYEGNIYCYSSDSVFLGRVRTNGQLLEGTSFVRINWKTASAPYFYSSYPIGELIAISEQRNAEKIDACVTESYNLNDSANDLIGYELYNGLVVASDGWRTSGFIKLESGYNYTANISGRYCYYNKDKQFIGAVYSAKGSPINTSIIDGAVYVRFNTNGSEPFVVNKLDSNNQPIVVNREFNEVSQKADGPIFTKQSKNIDLFFETTKSLYKMEESILFSADGLLTIKLIPISGEQAYFNDICTANIRVNCAGKEQNIPLRLNNYGMDLFSIRAKYPIVNVDNEGNTEIVETLPTELESCYIAKTDSNFTIYYGNGSVYEDFILSNFSDVSELIDEMMASSKIAEHFEIKKFGGEGVSFNQINNFDKVYLVKQHTEYLYGTEYSHETGASSPIATGKVYWDSYPTLIKTSDLGYEHRLRLNYKIVDNVITNIYCSFDGMFVRFEPMVMAQAFSVTHGAYINNLRYCEYPYKNIHTPMLSMLHSVVEGDAILGESMKITTFRLNSILSYLQRRGFVAQNYEECINTIRGINAVDSPTYCLSFDDFTKNLWTNENIRNIFNKYNAKPTLVYIIEGKDLIGDEPPIKAPTREEYQVIKNSGWSIIPHGYSAYTDKTSYAQFVKGFKLTKDKWVEWYGECPIAYNPHSMEIKDYQYNLLKQMGYGVITSGSAHLGWFCEAGTTINVQFKRTSWLDGELDWDEVKKNIDRYM